MIMFKESLKIKTSPDVQQQLSADNNGQGNKAFMMLSTENPINGDWDIDE